MPRLPPPREDDLREGFPAPGDNILKSINSFATRRDSYFKFLLIEASTSRYRTDQSGSALKITQKINFKKLPLEETHVYNTIF